MPPKDKPQEPAMGTPITDFRYDTLDTNYEAVRRQKKKDLQEERQAQSLSAKTKQRHNKDTQNALRVRQFFDDPINFPINTRKVLSIMGVVFVVLVFVVFHHNAVRDQMVHISRLRDSLERTKLDALHTRSELMRRTRKSDIHRVLNTQSDSIFETSPTPPYVIE